MTRAMDNGAPARGWAHLHANVYEVYPTLPPSRPPLPHTSQVMAGKTETQKSVGSCPVPPSESVPRLALTAKASSDPEAHFAVYKVRTHLFPQADRGEWGSGR